MMRLPFSFHSKVCRRIFFIFLGCALLPALTLALLYYWQVSDLLTNQANQRLCLASKNIRQNLHAHMDQLARTLHEMAELYQTHSEHFEDFFSRADFLQNQHLCHLAILHEDGSYKNLLGLPQKYPSLTPAQKMLLNEGKILLTLAKSPSGENVILMVVALPDPVRGAGFLAGELSRPLLLGLLTPYLPESAEVLVRTESGDIIVSSHHPAQSDVVTLHAGAESVPHGDVSDRTKALLESSWAIEFTPEINSENWVISVSKNREDALASLYRFRNAFYLVGILSFLFVSALSARHIRRNLIPLQRLQEGTHRISQGDFGHRIELNSRDEFETLADSLNDMAEKLDRQFHTLAQAGMTTRALLSALDREKIIVTVLDKVPQVVCCDVVSLALSAQEPGCFLVRTNNIELDEETSPPAFRANLSTSQLRLLYSAEESLFTSEISDFPELLEPVSRLGMRSFFILPIYQKGTICGLITLGFRNTPLLSREDSIRARSLADQVAVALANTRLMEELADLNYGTVTALARTVDAKSSWTAGHSERVTELAMAIGKALSLTPRALDQLQRASLLHDIGKIGVPNALLEKPGPLTEAEYARVKTHPEKGARILEPIQAYRDILPIVEQHHEWFNGQGYPKGLQGEQIAPGARILAVADVYDALISDRPYRSGWLHADVIAHIENRAGQQFDPDVVRAFLQALQTLPLTSTSGTRALQG